MVLATAERAAREKGMTADARNFNSMHRCVSEIMDTLEHGLEDRLFAPIEAVRESLELGGMTVSTCPVLPNGCVIDLVGVLGRDPRLRQVVRRLNPGATVTSREVRDGPSHETAVLVTVDSPSSGGRAWRRQMRVGWGEPLESWRCLVAGIAKDGSFDINLLARYICERLQRIIVTYPNFCAFNARPRGDPSVSRVLDRLADPQSSRMYQGSFELSAKENWAD